MRVSSAGLWGIIALITFVGCGVNGSVTGIITANGETVDGGNIIFQPIEAGAKPAIGAVGSDGNYDLKTAGDEGLSPGEYRVIYTPPNQREDESGRPVGKLVKWRKFKAPSETVNVEAKENTIPIELVKQ
ncbi:hypothetical protein M4951_02590 [Blastopirellula sp. J2-11]|uniref:hypothetical protein n=1 Tax=Blastopirellula sp. J2-11 TaxID=2943192 RepID=UPI0021C5DD66|nr:hypothetical protein [Blastopirellula sp. J2-11]UUO07209.1 hypothetical protein M4951_02590 [Blastopirellula sp. J2-11]